MRRYTLENLQKVVRQPGYVGWELYRILFDIRYKGHEIDVMDEDWDNLILLDACRYDYFEKHHDLPGNLSRVVSHGGRSWEFMQGNFVNEQFHDTVYVTANPHTEKLDSHVFHAVEPLYLTRWDEERETVLPQDVVDASLNAFEKYPNKRIIVHFMQPHRPYLGEAAQELQEIYPIRGFNRNIAHEGARTDQPSYSTLLEKGVIPIDKTREAYQETLEIVLGNVESLVHELGGKTVVSSDHGELLGEKAIPFTRPKFGHSHKFIRNSVLYRVPWLEIPSEERRNVRSDPPEPFNGGSDEEVKKRLESLGYR